MLKIFDKSRKMLLGFILAGCTSISLMPVSNAEAQSENVVSTASQSTELHPKVSSGVETSTMTTSQTSDNDHATTNTSPVTEPGGNVTPASPIPSTESKVVVNPYGLSAMWAQGDIIARSTLVILLLMSLTSWCILITKLIEQSKESRQARRIRKQFWLYEDVDAAKNALPERCVFRHIAQSGLVAHGQYQGPITSQIDLNSWLNQCISQAIDTANDRLQGGLSVLATVGSTAPFVGLFGTVWGIYHALTEIGISGQASIDKVAGPVGESLIMTAIGLAVAVPAVLGYNWLIRRNKYVIDEMRFFGGELHTVLLGGKPSAMIKE